ncbi:MAG: TonB-dependent receptor [Gemmatimonadales bacterium]
MATPAPLGAQGVTTGAIQGLVTDTQGEALVDATVVAVHVPTGTRYRAFVRQGGAYNLPNLRVGGPYRVTTTYIGAVPTTREDVFLNLGETLRLDFQLERRAVQVEELVVAGEENEVLNAGRTGAETYIGPREILLMPTVKRSTRDLTKLDPRSDGNYSFAGRNWLYNNVSLDGSYFNNPFGLDDPAPGGQANGEPVPYDAIEQVEVSIAPFDVREGGFTGANVNIVTKSGTNQLTGSAYAFLRNDAFQGNTVSGNEVVANPDLSYLQSGFAVSGPILRDKLFFFLNGEIERTDNPGTDFVASQGGSGGFGVSRVAAADLDAISERLATEYGYETGPYEGYIFQTDNDKVLAKLDYNLNQDNTFTLRYNYLDATRDQGPHPFVLSFNNTGRGPNTASLPFRNSGYAINNNLNSVAFEWNSRTASFANRFFASYNRFRDNRDPFSADFPTIEIGQDGVTYTTAGHEPFSIHNILDQDVWQVTNNFSLFRGNHVFTVGVNYEKFSFFNSFNIFRHGFFPAVSTFPSVQAFMDTTDPGNPAQIEFDAFIGTGPFKGENIDASQLGLYAQDEFLISDRFNLTYGLRVDFPSYGTEPVDNPFSRSRIALDENGNSETVDQSSLPGADPLFSPRVGFNWNAVGDRQTQVRGGTGVFTGRIPFVWFGNVISNPGANPNIFPGAPPVETGHGSVLQQSFDLNAMDPDFQWPQVWTTDLAVDQRLPWEMLGTFEVIYAKDINAVVMRNADLNVAPADVGTVPGPDGRPFYGLGAASSELNPDGAGIYVIDNTDEGHSFNATAQLRKTWSSGFSAMLAYSYTDADNAIQSTEIASVLWQLQPVQGNPNQPGIAPSQFGQRHRFIAAASWGKQWSPSLRTQIGLFFEAAEGNRYTASGGNRFSVIYSGDVNGDGQAGNDLIYVPRDAMDPSEVAIVDYTDGNGVLHTEAEQRAALETFIRQDDYLRENRGRIADRNGLLNPWYNNLDLKILQDFALGSGTRRHVFQLSLDVLNFGNLISSDWGVRKVANPSALSPLRLDPTTYAVTPYDGSTAPVLNFTGPSETFIDDPGIFSRWQAQIGLRYYFE